MRPNYAQDAPPTSLEVGGFSYKINTDFRIWLEVMRLMRETNFSDASQDGLVKTIDKISEIETLVFGGVLADESIDDIFKAIGGFLAGYPTAPVGSSGDGGTSAPTYSFQYDLSEIIIAIKDQHGIDCSYRNKDGVHWWEFLLNFRTLSGDHYITNLMQARGYKGKDKDLIKRRNAVALPVEYTAEEQAEVDAFNELFETESEEQKNGNQY